MKAAIALLVLYVGMFFVAIQGGSTGAVQAAAQGASSKHDSPAAAMVLDPAKETDIRALLELTGARDQLEDSVRQTAEQYRERLLATLPSNDQGQAFVNTTINEYEKRFDAESVNDQLVRIYDRHFTVEEIRGLLQFYGSPLGQKAAAEGPRIFREIQEATRAEASKAVKGALEEAQLEHPRLGPHVQLSNPGLRRSAPSSTASPENVSRRTPAGPDSE